MMKKVKAFGNQLKTFLVDYSNIAIKLVYLVLQTIYDEIKREGS